jgi:hypothetical protein
MLPHWIGNWHSLQPATTQPFHVQPLAVVPPLPPRSLPKRGELGEEAKNSLFTNPPPRYEPAITLDSVKSGAIDVDAVLNNQPVAGNTPAQPQVCFFG